MNEIKSEHLAYSILFRATQGGYITTEQADSSKFQDAAESISERHRSDDEIGSSDWTYIIKEFLEELGYETYFNNEGVLCLKK